jgi:DNA (cytosine-5)-methyltransferase 1
LIASTGNVAHCLNAGAMGRIDYETETMIAHALRGEGFDASEDGTGRGTPLAPIAFDCKASGRNGFAIGEISPTLTVPSKSGGGQPTAVAFQSSQSGVRLDDVHATLDSHNGSRRHNGVVTGWAVRRLTPRECERLQGFPDGYTDIPWRGKDHAPDGLRYKALGNSMAVNVMRWIGMRIQHVSDLAVDEAIGAHQ